MSVAVRPTGRLAGNRPLQRELLSLVVVVAAAIAVGGLASAYSAEEWTLWVIYGLLALSFTFIWGYGGIFSFGQAAFFGIGAYAYSVASIDISAHTNETITAVIIAVAVSALAAGLLGYFIFYGKVRDVGVAIITLAASLVLLTMMSGTAGSQYHIGSAQLGGYNGMVGVLPLTYGLPGGTPTSLGFGQMLTVFMILAGAIAIGIHFLLRRPFGRIVVAIRVNELRTQLLGYDVRRYKLVTFMIGGGIAGVAGAGYAAWGTFINPSVFSLQQAAFIAIWVLLGGRTSLLGAFVGVVLVQEITSALGGSGSNATPIVLGAVLVAVVLLLPAGIVPTLKAWLGQLAPAVRARLSRAGAPAASSSAPASVLPVASDDGVTAQTSDEQAEDGALAAADLSKRFGGLTALRSVSLRFPSRGVRCLIGPNGAGKSTFFNLLVGRYRPSSGEVTFRGERITRWRPDQRARCGIGIKLQVPSLYYELSTLENLWLAAYGRSRNSRGATDRALAILLWLNLLDRAHEPASTLSHGQQQWLDIAMVVAAEPAVILLDEPTAGMTREETRQTAQLVKSLAAHAVVIVVEHDMEFVRELDAPVTVFHEGGVFAEGNMSELRDDERILDIYLGRPISATA